MGTVDLDAVKAAGYDTTTMIVITNIANYSAVKQLADGTVQAGDDLIAVVGKN